LPLISPLLAAKRRYRTAQGEAQRNPGYFVSIAISL
jgi:hypothetical protein